MGEVEGEEFRKGGACEVGLEQPGQKGEVLG